MIERRGVGLGQLEAFVQVARHRSFSKAAETLFLSQPSVSARIQNLEKELGEPLFRRNGRSVLLTEVGQTFLPYAERILQSVEAGLEALEALQNLNVGALHLGCAFSISTYVLPKLLKLFTAQHPRIEISTRTGRSEQVIRTLLADEVHAGLVHAVPHPEIEMIHLYDDEIVLVTDPKHPFARRRRVPVDAVVRQPFVFFAHTSNYFRLTSDIFRRANTLPRAAMELDSLEAAKKMVEAGLGITLLPRVSVERELELGFLAEIEIEGVSPLRRPIAFIHRRNRRPNRVVQAFLETLQECYHFRLPDTLSVP